MNQPLPDLSGLLNLPDLLLALFLIWSVVSGARRGFLGAVFGLVGRIAVIAGAALGLVGGVAVVLLLLWCAHLVYPDLFSELGWLSPARIQSTVLLRGLLAYFPI